MKKNKFLVIFTLMVYIFLLGPLLIIIGASFSSENFLAFPPKGFSLKWFENILNVEMFMETLKISLGIAFLATMVALIMGIPAAYAINRYNFKGKNVLNGIFVSPVLIPGIVLGFALLKFLMVENDFPVYLSLFIGHAIILFPYAIRVVSSSLSNFDYSIEEAAMSLGLSKGRTFFKVVLPNIKSGVIAAFILAFINSFNNVPLSVFLSGPGVSTLPIQMLSYVEYNYDPTIAALSVVLMVFTIVLMVIVEKTLGLSYFAK
ncbi:ABC transporter permease [Clostridium sp. HMP27]|uniref:ABC transporter permease n=1 Tax=Clostridium sp. HMP27 TaxID=1487921 RepID=UPI00052C1947|nr:ABC transporter permease [Clostridium sp. HMP27]KGK87633.1 spermidine/putrescine ABC transporter ATP-binding protein [Clostridium sp. HMP27]